jgi:hypothetical protein
MSKINQVAAVIATLEQGRFQRLSNNYLKKTIGGELHSPGSVEANDKTRKGKPDAYLFAEDGSYVLAEHTTKETREKTSFYAKLEKGLRDCLDFENLGIPKEKIRKIILCCNSSVEPEDREKLNNIAEEYSIALGMVTIDDLSNYYSTAGKVYAKEYLSIPYDTGQILDKEQFLTKYHVKNLSTRLDNELVGRDREYAELVQVLFDHRITMVTGKAGIGKTRLCLAAMDYFLAFNPDFQPYYIFTKSGPITDDLLTYLEPGRPYLIFIDDANRQLENMISILEQLVESETIIKILITVRDYAKDDILEHIGELDFQVYDLYKLSSEVIANIIGAAPFNISKPVVISRIIEISKGNPRLALMAAKVVKDDQDVHLLKDVSMIYDEYYQPTIDENHIFSDPLTLKVLGLIAFFSTMDEYEPFDVNTLACFNISLTAYETTAKALEQLEIIDIYTSICRINEQELSSYFFYLTFIKKQLLSLELLLEKYFETHYWRFKDTILPAINTFGEQLTFAPHKGIFLKHWNKIKTVPLQAVRFMDIFGKYLPEQLLAYVHNHIKQLESNSVEEDFPIRRHKGTTQNKDNVISLLNPLFNPESEHFTNALELLLINVARQPEKMDVITDLLKPLLFPTGEDQENAFKNILAAYELLNERSSISYRNKYIFYYVMENSLLSGSYFSSLYVKKTDKYILTDILLGLRNRFWEELIDNYDQAASLCFDVLMNYLERKHHFEPILLEADKPYVIKLINQHLNPEHFGDSYFVIKYLELLEENSLLDTGTAKLEKKFRSSIYQNYELLNLDRAKYRKLEKQGKSWEEINELNRREIIQAFPVLNLSDFKKIYLTIGQLQAFPYAHLFDLSRGLYMLLECIFDDIELGFQVMEHYLSNGNLVGLNPVYLFNKFYKSGIENTRRLYQLLLAADFKYKETWLERYFDDLPVELIERETITQLLDLYRGIKGPFEVHAAYFIKYEQFMPGTMARLMTILVKKRKDNPKFHYTVSHDFFIKLPMLADASIDLCKKIYYQQEHIKNSFDYDGKQLFFLIGKQPALFAEYVDHIYQSKQAQDGTPRTQLTRIWENENAQQLVYDSVLKIRLYDLVLPSDHFCAIFFSNIKPEYHPDAESVLKRLVRENSNDVKIMNVVLDVCRNNLPALVDELIKEILLVNDNIEHFKKFAFYNNHFGTSSGEIWADLIVRKLTGVYQVITSLPSQYRYYDHQDFLSNKIQNYIDEGNYQRRLQYRGLQFH